MDRQAGYEGGLHETRPLSRDTVKLLTAEGFGGTYEPDEIKAIVNGTISPFLRGRLADELAGYSSRRLLLHLGTRLDAAAKSHMAGVLAGTAAGQSAEVWRHTVRTLSGSTRDWQLLLELALSDLPNGTRHTASLNERLLVQIADEMYFWSQLSDRIHYGLAAPSLMLTSDSAEIRGLSRVIDIATAERELTQWMAQRPEDPPPWIAR